MSAEHTTQQETSDSTFPLINLNENLENQFKATFTMMLDLFEKQDGEEAETLAHELLLWGNLPVLYRSYAHMVLAYGVANRMFHARKAVEEAEWGINKYGDKQGVDSKLLAAAQRTLADVEADEAQSSKGDDQKQEVVHTGPLLQEAADIKQETEESDEDDEMILEEFEADLGEIAAAKQKEKEEDITGIVDEMLFDNFNEIPEVADAVMDNAEAIKLKQSENVSGTTGTRTVTTTTTKFTEATSKGTDMTSIGSQGSIEQDEADAGKKRDRSDGSHSDDEQPPKKKLELDMATDNDK
ncbi:hypothetical protein D6D04_05545 [Aureobasidium pullulans]|nr:hypothetical protein D6D04_05545 [Aureobasidium pullulans]